MNAWEIAQQLDTINRERRVIEAGHWAPSAHNRQPWRFAVITDPARRDALARAMGERTEGLSEKEQAMAFITGLKKLIQSIGLDQHKLSGFGIQRTDLRKLAENAFHTMGKLFAITPVKLTLDDATAIYERAYA